MKKNIFALIIFTLTCLGIHAQDRLKKVPKEPPPIPLHGIEGYGGAFSTYSAYLVNAAKPGKVFGLPSVSETYVYMGKARYLSALTVTETLWDRVELGFAWNRFGLGDLDTIMALEDEYVDMYNANLRTALIKEGAWGMKWMPAITAGVHYKYNDTVDSIDDELGGALTTIGIRDHDGIEYTLHASKMVTALPLPILFNVGVRATRASNIGLLGFTDHYQYLPEASALVFLSSKWALAGEYRWKPKGEYTSSDLIREEDDWWTLCAAYVVNNNMTVAVGYGHFGDVMNHTANSSWGISLKWEF